MRYRIGLDIGIGSVGWATLLLDEKGEPYKIHDLGVRIFDKAENPKNGSPLAEPRRKSRGSRRRNRRHRHRLVRIKKLLELSGVITEKEIADMYNSPRFERDVYELRSDALERKLKNEELSRVLIHLAQRRGFKSNRKSNNSDSEQGKLLEAVDFNKKLLEESTYRTIGEMLHKDTSNFGTYESTRNCEERLYKSKRNKKDSYLHTFYRSMLVDEIELIFKSQRELGNAVATEELENKYLNIYTSQRSFEEGPGEESPYAGNQIEKMLGNCTFIEGEKRAPKGSYTFERFMLLNKINTLRIGEYKGETRALTEEERKLIIDKAYSKNAITFKDLSALLKLNENEYFKGLLYGKKEKEKVEKDSKFVELKAYHSVRAQLDKIDKGYINKLSEEQLDYIGYALTVYKNDEGICSYLSSSGIEDKVIEKLLPLSFSKVGHLSLKAIKEILPLMEEGMDYDKACTSTGYDYKGKGENVRSIKLKPIKEELVNNPVVKRAISQTIKVINGIARQYGEPSSISIELAREVSKSYQERSDIDKKNEANMKKNQEAVKQIKELFNREATGEDIIKYKLWKEQQGHCPYSDSAIEIARLFESGYTDVDHIIPYSISFDNSYNNKILVKSSENRQKGNRTPLQYMEGKDEKRDKFLVWVETYMKGNYVKKQNLLKKSINEDENEDFRERNLNDTRYITRIIYNYINDNMKFKEDDGRKKVFAINGAVTSYVRKRWGLSKVREEGDLHHALDAITIACITDSMIQRISSYHKSREVLFKKKSEMVDEETGEVLSREEFDKKYGVTFPKPWKKFREEVKARLSENPNLIIENNNIDTYKGEEVKPIFVSRMPRRKNTGPAHGDTMRSAKLFNEGYTILKTSLSKLKLDKYGEIEGYYNAQDDILLYEALKARLEGFDGKGENAFEEPFYKPRSNGERGPLVKKVKIMSKSNLGVYVNENKGIADNISGSMIRVDVFERDKKYFLVPIYVSDTKKKQLPNKAIAAKKAYKDWIEMKDEEFIFSLYPNDLIRIKHKRGVPVKIKGEERVINDTMVYYIKLGSNGGEMNVIAHDKSFQIQSLGAKTLESLEKYTVDVLGNYHKINKEKRVKFNKEED